MPACGLVNGSNARLLVVYSDCLLMQAMDEDNLHLFLLTKITNVLTFKSWELVVYQYPLKPDLVQTIHTAQGSTLTSAIIDVTRIELFDRATLYTAVTRGIIKNGLRFVVDPSHLPDDDSRTIAYFADKLSKLIMLRDKEEPRICMWGPIVSSSMALMNAGVIFRKTSNIESLTRLHFDDNSKWLKILDKPDSRFDDFKGRILISEEMLNDKQSLEIMEKVLALQIQMGKQNEVGSFENLIKSIGLNSAMSSIIGSTRILSISWSIFNQ